MHSEIYMYVFWMFVVCSVTMEEAKEVHSNLRNAGGIFKFVKVLRKSKRIFV